MGVARTLVQGCDVWLNTPRRPQEASGTSGMKAAMNGVLNLLGARRLVARGVRARARLGDPGHATTRPTRPSSTGCSRRRSSRRTATAGRWDAMMKASIERLTPRFAMHRAVREYVEGYYLPAHRSARS